MAGAATIRRIAADVPEIAFLVTAGTLFRGPGRADRKVALATSPISQVALRADIPGEFAGSGKAAQGTFLFLFLGRHQSRLPFSLSLIFDPIQQFLLSLMGDMIAQISL
jgi:hypothetical protein